MNVKIISAITAAAIAGVVTTSIFFENVAVADKVSEISLMANGVFDGGSGTKNDPFLISDEHQFAVIADLPDFCYELKNDITLPADWKPIGSDGENFSGVLNGAGYTIYVSGFRAGMYMGIFDANNGEIRNLNIDTDINYSTSSNEYDRFIGGFCGENTGIITNCSISGTFHYRSTAAGSPHGVNYVYIGGMTGINSGIIESCSVKMDFVSIWSINSYFHYAGALTAVNSGEVTNCYFIGNHEVDGSIYSGGLIARNRGEVKNTYSAANVTGECDGGLIGYNYNDGTVSDSYYDKDLSGLSDTGKGEPKTTLGMKLQPVYENWDFNYTWAMDSGINEGYPYLRHEVINNEDEPNLSAEVTNIEFKKTSSGAEGSVSVSIYNQSARNTSTSLIVGIYDKEDRLAGIKYVTKTISPGVNNIDITDISAEGNIQSSYSAKVYIWDSVRTMTPMTDAIPFTV